MLSKDLKEPLAACSSGNNICSFFLGCVDHLKVKEGSFGVTEGKTGVGERDPVGRTTSPSLQEWSNVVGFIIRHNFIRLHPPPVFSHFILAVSKPSKMFRKLFSTVVRCASFLSSFPMKSLVRPEMPS